MFAVCLQFTIKKAVVVGREGREVFKKVTSLKCKRAGLDLGQQCPW